jgi:chromosome segregation ATPase
MSKVVPVDPNMPVSVSPSVVETPILVELTKINIGLEYIVKDLKRLDAKFDAVDKRFDAVDKRFDAVDKKFEAVDKKFEALEKKLDTKFDLLDVKIDKVEARLEAKIDKVEAALETKIEAIDNKIDSEMKEIRADNAKRDTQIAVINTKLAIMIGFALFIAGAILSIIKWPQVFSLLK